MYLETWLVIQNSIKYSFQWNILELMNWKKIPSLSFQRSNTDDNKNVQGIGE